MLHALGRKVMAVVLMSGILLMGAVPSWAASIADSNDNMPNMMVMMQGMATPCNCAEMMSGKMPANQMPCKNCSLCYAISTAFSANIGLMQHVSLATLLRHDQATLFAARLSPDGIVHPPALPHPII